AWLTRQKSLEPQRHRGTEKAEYREKKRNGLLCFLSVLFFCLLCASVPLWFKTLLFSPPALRRASRAVRRRRTAWPGSLAPPAIAPAGVRRRGASAPSRPT